MHQADTDSGEAATRARILVVDDDPGALDTLGRLLSPHYEVFVASGGARGLQLASASQPPDLILLDVLMPGLDGYAVLARLQGNPATRDIPVILVSGLNSTDDEKSGLDLGAVDYIAKPYRAPIVLARVRMQLELKRARDVLADRNANLESEVARRLKEVQQIQVQLLQSEKMAAIGQLAAGIIHEINGPVGFVKSNLGTLASYLPELFELLDAYEALGGAGAPDDAARVKIRELRQAMDVDFLREDIAQLVDESKQGLHRIAKIVSDLKGFSHIESNDWQWANLHEGIDSTLNIVWNEIKYHCSLRKDYGNLPAVYCMPSQINQVFMNLLVNAAQAIPDRGEITIRSAQVGHEVCISITDTGSGIPPENLSRLFEPFFTTKPVGKGTGLGLSISYGIVQRHGGRIEVVSAPGKGTTFSVWLPVQPPADAATATAA